MAASKLKLYYMAQCPYCQAVLKALDTFGLDCELLPKSKYSEEVKAITGGTVPILLADDEVITESKTIIQYLSDNFGEGKEIVGNTYGLQTEYDGNMEEAEAVVTTALKDVGFGILTRIDVAETLKKKIDLVRPPYVILGACNPKIAAEALEMEPDLGLLLPCNVVVRINDAGKTEIAVIHPMKMLGVVGRVDMLSLAEQVMKMMKQVIATVSDAKK
ncbi:MAG: DUF302 domain-containing protein [Ghiorsea sp.]